MTGEKLYGVGGWLGFFIVTRCMISPITTLLAQLNDFKDPNLVAHMDSISHGRFYEYGSWIVSILYIGATFFMAHRLLKYFEPKTVKITIWVIWLTSLVPLVSDYAMTAVFLDISPSEVYENLVPTDWGSYFGMVLWPAIWTAYFLKSERIENTYYNMDIEQARTVFE